jgi:hypothetical protein
MPGGINRPAFFRALSNHMEPFDRVLLPRGEALFAGRYGLSAKKRNAATGRKNPAFGGANDSIGSERALIYLCISMGLKNKITSGTTGIQPSRHAEIDYHRRRFL